MADDQNRDRPIPEIHQQVFDELLESPGNRTAFENALLRVLKEKRQGSLAAHSSSPVTED